MKTAIIYYSKHHGNTKKLLDAIKAKTSDEIVLINATSTDAADLNGYDRIGFASGIYFSNFEKRVVNFAKKCLPKSKDIFFIYTYGAEKKNYTNAIRKAVADKNANILGEYGCFGFDTFGPFRLIGGIAKGHPDIEEIDGAVKFYNNLT